jgi:hypothetical protein
MNLFFLGKSFLIRPDEAKKQLVAECYVSYKDGCSISKVSGYSLQVFIWQKLYPTY